VVAPLAVWVALVVGRTQGSAPTGDDQRQWQIVGATPRGCPIGGACGGWRSRLGGHGGPLLRVMVNAMANRRGNPLWLPRRRVPAWVAFAVGRTQGSAPTGDGATQWQIVGATPVVAPSAAWVAFAVGQTQGSAPTGDGATGNGPNRVGAISCGCPAAQAGYLACSSDLRRRMSGISVGSTPLSSASQ
jgi:hypothetical protein